MSSNAISAATSASPPAAVGTGNNSRWSGGSGDVGSTLSARQQGISVFASLLQALVQATQTPSAATTPATGTAPATSSTAAAAAPGSGGTSNTNLGQDLQSFLHDLAQALRATGRAGHGDRHGGHGGGHFFPPNPVTTTSASTTTSSATAPVAAATTSAATAPSTPVTTPTTAPVTAGVALVSAAPVSSTTGAATALSAAGQYDQGGIIAALQVLIKDLGNSQVLSSSTSTSGLSSNVLSNLNTAFQTLITALDGNSPSTGSGGATAGSNTSGTAGAAASSTPSTAALQSFLTNFLSDLQNNGTNSVSPLGTSVNTTA
jgi:hypothetical protein